MSGLYNALFGVNPMAPVLLAALGIKHSDIPRFGDAYLDGEKKQIVIYTRTGGGNRDYYEGPSEDNEDGPFNEGLREVPGFISDEDDEFDCTYAHFRYSFPKEYEAELTALCEQIETITPGEKWSRLLEDLSKAEPTK